MSLAFLIKEKLSKMYKRLINFNRGFSRRKFLYISCKKLLLFGLTTLNIDINIIYDGLRIASSDIRLNLEIPEHHPPLLHFPEKTTYLLGHIILYFSELLL